ncbi:MAG: hypothetical protein MPJ22_00420 [Pirellulales bacterium]|nr:hypothetical protein [Alphaproteobacteria bacterium]MDA8040872.1 hypothetical protein [Pirellulales bacterium]
MSSSSSFSAVMPHLGQRLIGATVADDAGFDADFFDFDFLAFGFEVFAGAGAFAGFDAFAGLTTTTFAFAITVIPRS